MSLTQCISKKQFFDKLINLKFKIDLKMQHFFIKIFLVIFFQLISIHAQELDLDKISNLKIRSIGPSNMSGRITAIDVVTKNTKIIYVGAASGGVWKSENGGTAWKPIFDEQPTQNIGAINIFQDNPNIVWVGTGEGNPRNSMNLGNGIYKSVDGGKTWKHMGLGQTKTIHRIISDPKDPNVLYVGAMGDPFSPSENRGLYKTNDGGKTWKRILFSNKTSGVADLVIDPKNSKKLFATLYEHKRTTHYFKSGGPGSGIYLTEDGGESWKKLTTKNGLPRDDLGRIGIAIAPSNPDRVYAKIEAIKNSLYRSDDGGKNWYLVNDNPKFTNNRPFYFQDLAVDSKDPDRLYNIYQPLSVSYDGGKSFDKTPMIPADETKGIHADFHAFWVNPNDPHNFIIGGDGGIGITNDHGKSWYFPETIPVAQFYHIDVDYDTPYNVYGGMQDNGNWSGPAYTWKRGGIRTLYWQYLVGGDGFYISPDKNNSRFGYGTSQNGELYRYDKLTGYYVSIKPPNINSKSPLRFNWNSAFAKDPFDDNAIYYGSQYVHYSNDKGATWSVISEDLTTDNKEHQKGDYGGLTLDISGAEVYNSLLTIAPSSLDKNIIWTGSDDGQIYLTTDGGKRWKSVSNNIINFPDQPWITQIKASKYYPGTAWAVVNNYRKGDYKSYLYKTSDYGKSWIELLDGKKIQGYSLSLIQDPMVENLIFLGTENGLWISLDNGINWKKFRNGYPSVSTMDMVIQENESALVIGTFGRAIWILDDLLSLREIARGNIEKEINLFPVNDVVQVKGLFINPPGNIWTGFNTTFEGENKIFQKAKIPFYLNTKIDSLDKVKASIFDSKGKKINELYSSNLVEGLNYIIWGLDETSESLIQGRTEKKLRGIPVLPDIYKILIEHNNKKDSIAIKIIEDPRFNISNEVDEEMYFFKKSSKKIVKQINAVFKKINNISDSLKVIQLTMDNKYIKNFIDLKTALNQLRENGKETPKNRQVGAWKSNLRTPYSMVSRIEKIGVAGVNKPSKQHWERLNETKKVVDRYQKEVDDFIKKCEIFFEKLNSIQ